MKKILLKIMISIFLIFNQTTNCQNFFPVNIGNAFQYRGVLSGNWPGGGGSYDTWFRFFLSKDTIIDGKKYYKFIGDNLILSTTFYFTNPIFFYDQYEQKLFVRFQGDSLDKLAADFKHIGYYTSYLSGEPLEYYSYGINVDTIWGRIVKSYSMEHNTPYKRKKFKFVDGLGLCYQSMLDIAEPTLWSSSFDSLVAVIVDSLGYNNNFSVNFLNLSPLINRPLDAFPFVLTASYSAMVPKLIDSFYVEIWHIRNDTIKRYFKVDFSYSQAYVPILPSWLKVGDIIKIRAKISEKSIFRNTDYFPEKGFAYIKVLPAITDVNENNLDLRFVLEQNHPNPFNPSTMISWQSPVSGWQTLKIYDILGNEIATLVDEYRDAGRYEVEFNAVETRRGLSLPSGVYFYQLRVTEPSSSSGQVFVETKKMILMR